MTVAWTLLIVSQLLAIARLLRYGSRYRTFAAYLVVDLIRVTTLFFLRGDASGHGWRAYSRVWLWTEPVSLTLLVFAARELINHFPEHFRGFGDFGRNRLRALLQVAIGIAMLSSLVEARAYPWNLAPSIWIPLLVAAKRMITSALTAYFLLTAVWLSTLRVPMQPNLLRHAFLFAVYLVFETTVMLWEILIGGHGSPASNFTLMVGSLTLFLLWATLLTRKGEATPKHRTLSPIEIEEINRRQQELTDVLFRAAKRRE